MPTFTYAYGSNRAILAVDINAITNDPVNNRTLVRLTGRIYDGNSSLGGFGTGSWNIGLDGSERGAGSFAYNFGNQGISYTFFNNDYWITHSANGTRSVYGYVNFNGFTGLIGAGSAGGTVGLTDYEISTGNIWNGTTFVKGVPYMWNGTAWVASVPRLWNGTAWVAI
jgi:hypothetical protein